MILLPQLVGFGVNLEYKYLPLMLRAWPPPGRLVISEILYDTSGKEPDGEWVEFYNVGYRTLNLSDYKFGDEETIGGGEGMLQFPPGAAIEPGEVIVVASLGTAFETHYGRAPDYEMRESDPGVMNMIKYTAWAGGSIKLDNTGDEVLILDGKNAVVDAVSYGSSTYYFDPSAGKTGEEQSLERSPVYQDTDSAADWVVQTVPNPWIVDLSEPTPSPSPTSSQQFTTTPTSTGSATATETNTPQPTPAEGRLLISEVFYDPVLSEPANEWIELHNSGGSTFVLTGVKLGDEEIQGGSEGMLQFPDGAVMVSGQVIVVANRADDFLAAYGFLPDYEMTDSDPAVPDLSKYSAWANGNVYMSNSGDEVLLLAPDDSLMDAVSWGESTWAFDPAATDVLQGHSLERRPVYQDTDSAGDWVDQAEPQPGLVEPPSVTPTPTPTGSGTVTATHTATGTPTLTKTNTLTLTPSPTGTSTATIEPTPLEGRLLISEVLYDPAGDEPANEWIELYNAGGNGIDLTGYKIGDEETQGQGEGMYRFPDGISLVSGGVIVIANQALEFETVYGFKPDYELVESDPEVPNLVKYSDWASGSVALNNTGDDVLILGATDNLVDALSWGSSTWAFDPSAPDVAQGCSLARSPVEADTDTAYDWVEQDVPNPGEVAGGDGWLVILVRWLLELF